MRAVLVAVCLLVSSCSFIVADAPGPRCVEANTAVSDGIGAAVSGLVAVGLWTWIGGCLDRSCTPHTGAYVLASSVTVVAGAYLASAIHGARRNAACRRARAAPAEE